mgnify:CR=1 FL=1
MQGKILKSAVIIIMLSLLSMLFGCSKEPQYPFDTEKAYYISRGGIIAGGNYEIKTNPEKYTGKDLPCAEDLAKSGELIEANNAQEADEKYQAKVQEQKSAAETVADPILSTSGQYVFSENDLAITIHGTTFNIGRFYNSSKTTSDNLGKDWYFTLTHI